MLAKRRSTKLHPSDELDDLVELFLLGGIVGAVLPELVEPGELEAGVVLAWYIVGSDW